MKKISMIFPKNHIFALAIIFACFFVTSGIACASVILADYHDDFQGGAPKAGWSYLWNSTGTIGNPANYSSLLWNGSYYDSNGLPGLPDDYNLARFVYLDATSGHPGGGVQLGAGVDRYAIAAYTLGSGGATFITDSYLKMAGNGAGLGGGELRIYVNSALVLSTPIFVNSLSSAPFDLSLGNLVAGDTIYFTVGPNLNDNSDTFNWDFTIQQNVMPKPVANKAPVAAFSATPLSGAAPLTVNLDASASTDEDSAVALYAWNSSDGQSTNGKFASFTYNSAGTPTITLKVTDDKGATHSTQKTISVSAKPVVNKAPLASFSATPPSGTVPLTVNLDASASTDSDGNVALYTWSSSDGQSKNGKLASFEFSTAGAPVITLTVTDDKGATHSTQKTIDVKPKPAANQAPVALFGARLSAAVVPLTVTLDASPANDPDGNINSYAWRLSDGRTASGKVVSFDFSKAGPASATLTVTDNQGATASLTLGGDLPGPAAPATPSTGGEGYIWGTILDACNQKPLKNVDVQFSSSGQSPRIQQTNRDGYYELSLPGVDYTVSATYAGYGSDSRTIDLRAGEWRQGSISLKPAKVNCNDVQPAEKKQALIVAGTGPMVGADENHLWEYTLALTDRAYTALRLQGFKREDIRYLSADGLPRNADEGVNVVSGMATKESLKEALTQWGGGVEQMVVYLVGHGGVGNFQLGRESRDLLTTAELKPWLDTLQGKLIIDKRGQPGKLSLILDACKSGSFIAPLAAKNRYVVSSTAADLDAIISNKDGSNSFSYHFWGQIGFKDGWLSKAFQQARQSMSGALVAGGKTQKAMLDADGSGGETSEDDYVAVGNYCYGNCDPHASVPVVIESVSPLENLGGKMNATLRVRANKPVKKAWVNIQRPDYHFPTNGTAISSLLQLDLDCNGNQCQGEYNNFNVNDYYPVTFYVQDLDDNTAVPYTLKLYQSNVAYSAEKRNADAVYEPSTGVLTLKDVLAGGQHYYVELQSQEGNRFGLKSKQPLQVLGEASSAQPATFDGRMVVIPGVFSEGKTAPMRLELRDGAFLVQ